MIHVVLSAWALFLGIAMMMLGNGLQVSLLGLRATTEGFPTATTGLVMSAYYAGFLAGSTLAPRIVKNVGHVRSVWRDLDDRVRPIEHLPERGEVRCLSDQHGTGRRPFIVAGPELDLTLDFTGHVEFSRGDYKIAAALSETGEHIAVLPIIVHLGVGGGKSVV